MPVSRLKISNVGPFSNIEFRFDSQVNVFVGPNNSGKSSALAALGDVCVYPFTIPDKLLHDEPAKFTVHYQVDGQPSKQRSGQLPIRGSPAKSIGYWTRQRWRSWQKVIEKLELAVFVPAIRQSTDFRSKGPITEKKNEKTKLAEKDVAVWFDSEMGRYVEALPSETPVLVAKRKASFGESAYVIDDERLVQRMVELDYRAYRVGDPSIRQVIDTIAAISSEITDRFPVKFAGIGEDANGLFPRFETPDGIVPLNILSQGTHSIIHIIASIIFAFAEYHKFTKNFTKSAGILIIDEIDAHLHPSWHRRFIPALRKHLPNLQIFCSTHSPLVLGGLEAGQIQLLQRNADGLITVSTNEHDIVGWSVDEIMKFILQISAPTDIETEKMLQRLGHLQQRKRISAAERDEMNTLRKRVSSALISAPVEKEIEKIKEILKGTVNR